VEFLETDERIRALREQAAIRMEVGETMRAMSTERRRRSAERSRGWGRSVASRPAREGRRAGGSRAHGGGADGGHEH
jgi:hypothetical protein